MAKDHLHGVVSGEAWPAPYEHLSDQSKRMVFQFSKSILPDVSIRIHRKTAEMSRVAERTLTDACGNDVSKRIPSRHSGGTASRLSPQASGSFKLGNVAFGLGQSNTEFQTRVFKADRASDLRTTGLNVKDFL